MMEKKTNKISIFLPSLNGGGAERVMVTLANAIAERGFFVDLVLATAEGPYLKDVSTAVRIIDLKSKRIIKSLLPLVRYLQHERPTAMLSALSHANVVALLAQKISRSSTRVIVSERGLISGEHAIARGFFARLNYWLIPKIYAKADGICTVSHAASEDLANFINAPKHRIRTIYNPFDLARISTLAAEPLDHRWFTVGQPPVIIAMGRMNEAKDFHTLIRAFSKLREKKSARLVILGDGELRSDLENLLISLNLDTDSVLLPGFVKNPFSWLARSKVFVLSSRREGLPGALIEAMACGTPVVSTNCLSGPDEILQSGRWGKLVPVGDAAVMAEEIATTLNSSIAMQPHVRQRASDFEKEKAVDAYLEILGFPRQPKSSA